jgi:hypothetical protein
MVKGCELISLGSMPSRMKILLVFIASSLAVGPIQPPIQGVPETISLWVKWPGREADCLSPFSDKDKKSGVIPPVSMSSWHSV